MTEAEIAGLEKYLLSSDKSEYTSTLIPGTDSHNYFMALEYLQPGKELTKTQTDFIEKYIGSMNTERSRSIKIRYLLRLIETAKDEAERQKQVEIFNRQLTAYNLNHVQPSNISGSNLTHAKTTIPNSINDAILLYTLDDKIAEFYGSQNQHGIPKTIIGNFPANVLEKMNLELVSQKGLDCLEHILSTCPDLTGFEGLVKELAKLFKERFRANKNYTLPESYYSKMTLKQLVELKAALPEVSSNKHFIGHLFRKTFREAPEAASSSQNYFQDLQEKRKNLLAMYDWTLANATGASFDNLRDQLLCAILQNGLDLGVYDKKLFMDYLKSPKSVHGLLSEKNRKIQQERKIVYDSYWHSVHKTNTASWFSDEELISRYLAVFFEKETTYAEYQEYILERTLKNIFYKTKLQLGETFPDITEHLSESALKDLKDSKELSICKSNKKAFGPKEQVRLTLELKNIQSLIIRVFEISTENWYKKSMVEISDSINLDGLVAQDEGVVALSEIPIKKYRKDFDFDLITHKPRGIFVVEFIGGGMAARAIIKKGYLAVISHTTIHGQLFDILNEENQICKSESTGIFIEGTFHKANSEGKVAIPFVPSRKTVQALLLHEGFAEMASIELLEERYEFNCSFLYDKETLLMGNEAKFILQPRLFLNDVSVSLSLLKEVKVEVTSINELGIPSTQNYENLEASYQQDLVIGFPIPAKVAGISLSISAKISTNNKTVSAGHNVSVQTRQNDETLFNMYCRLTETGYKLYVLGRNGEPLQDGVLDLTLYLKHYQQEARVTLQTNSEGSVILGKLEGVRSFNARLKASPTVREQSQAWQIDQTQCFYNLRSAYNIVKGSTLALPHLELDLSENSYKLLEVESSSDEVIDNAYSKISYDESTGNILLSGLGVGRYLLKYRNLDETIQINVIDGSMWNIYPNCILTEGSITQLRTTKSNISFKETKFEGEKLSAQIRTEHPESTKVHLFAYQFLSNWTDEKLNQIIEKVRMRTSTTTNFPSKNNTYLSNKRLSEEFCYVLERKTLKRFVGNTLDKPQLLLKRKFLRDTTTGKEQLDIGSDFREKTSAASRRLERFADGGVRASSHQGYMPFDSLMNFLGTPAFVLANIIPDEKGNIQVEGVDFSKYSCVELVATSTFGGATQRLSVPEKLASPSIAAKDLRLGEVKESGKSYKYSREAHLLKKDDVNIIKDLTSTEMALVDSLKTVFKLQKEYCSYSGTQVTGDEGIEQFEFLAEWDKLGEEEKHKKYDKFSCNELNLFLFFKDPAYFEVFVKPFVANKVEKEFMDHFLLGNMGELREYLNLTSFNRLNALEMSLLVMAMKETHKADCQGILSWMENTRKLDVVPIDEFKKRFDTVLSSKQLTAPEPMIMANEDEFASISMSNYEPMSQAFNAPRMEQSRARPMMNMMSNVQPRMMMQQAYGCPPPPAGGNFGFGGPPPPGAPPMQSRSRRAPAREAEARCEMDFAAEEIMEAKCLNRAEFLDVEENYNIDLVERSMEFKKAAVVDGFKNLDKTKEYIERQYFLQKLDSSQRFVRLTDFYVDYVRHILTNGPDAPFLSQNFIFSNSTLTEVLVSLAILSLPFESAKHQYTMHEGRGRRTVAGSECMIFTKELVQSTSENLKIDISIIQRFYDPNDRYAYMEDMPNVKIEKKVEEYIKGKIYGSQVIVSNLTAATHEVQIVTEVPQGAIPVRNLDYTKSHTLSLDPYKTQTLEFFFYFPATGSFTIYPSSVAKDGRIIASAAGEIFEVQTEKKKVNLDKIEDILSRGSKQDILTFLSTKNLLNTAIFRFSDIYWLLKQKEMFESIIKILREKRIYDRVAWSYGFLHGDTEALTDLLREIKTNAPFTSLSYLDSPYLKVDNFKIYEYHPMVNARVHKLANDRNNILNNQFKERYQGFLKYLVEKGHFDVKDSLLMTYYLILQDRIQEAITTFEKIKPEQINSIDCRLQFDYFEAYLDFYRGFPKFEKARSLVSKYLAFPVISWRNLFIDLANQLAEYDGDETVPNAKVEGDEEDKKKANEKNAGKAEMLSIELEGTRIKATYQNAEFLRVSLYKVDLEVLFSRNPFLLQGVEDFGHVQPNEVIEKKVEKSSAIEHLNLDIPEAYTKGNVYIQVRSESKMQSCTYFSTSLKVQVNENYGQVKVMNSENKPLSTVYVKAYAKNNSNAVSFYKDGYTDIRGTFDYASLNTSELNDIKSFSILVMSDELGSIIKESKPPSTVGKIEGNVLDLKYNTWLSKQNVEFQDQRGNYESLKSKNVKNIYASKK